MALKVGEKAASHLTPLHARPYALYEFMTDQQTDRRDGRTDGIGSSTSNKYTYVKVANTYIDIFLIRLQK